MRGLVFCAALLAPEAGWAAPDVGVDVGAVVAAAVRPVMARYGVPGMAVGVVRDGRTYLFDFGVASLATKQPVTADTLFEVGSVSKTFTATLAAYAVATGHLSLADHPGPFLPALRGRPIDAADVLALATYTPGGFPLQLPEGITTRDQLMAYYAQWTPRYAPGTTRTYSNPIIGLLGLVAARSLGGDFRGAMAADVFAPLGLGHVFFDVPPAEAGHYAEGYTEDGTPARIATEVISDATGGLRMTAGDLLRWEAAQLGVLPVGGALGRAIAATHVGYFRLGAMVQGLVWEAYRAPVTLPDLLAGNSDKVSLAPNAVARIAPPSPADAAAWMNKTGSTNGFSAYVAFAPGAKAGVVVLANKRFPIAARVRAGWEILTRLTTAPWRPGARAGN